MGLMSHSEQQKAIETLKGKYPRCSNCGMTGGNIGDILGLPVIERAIPSGVAPGTQVVAVLPVTCRSCGHMTLFGAKDFVELEG